MIQWIEWGGNKVAPDHIAADDLIEVRFRNGYTADGHCHDFDWHWGSGDCDIVDYRVIKPAAALSAEKPSTSSPAAEHYGKCKIEPITYIQANDLGFEEGNVVKYVTRHKYKNGRQDLEKAIHYLQMLIAHDYPEQNV